MKNRFAVESHFPLFAYIKHSINCFIIQMFRKLYHLKPNAALHSLQALLGWEDCVTALLSHNASVLIRDVQGRTPVHLAASCGHAEILSCLLSAADRTHPHDPITDRHGFTPTHWAAYHGKGPLCFCKCTNSKVDVYYSTFYLNNKYVFQYLGFLRLDRFEQTEYSSSAV